jgi:hypothetical protein
MKYHDWCKMAEDTLGKCLDESFVLRFKNCPGPFGPSAADPIHDKIRLLESFLIEISLAN